MDDNTKAKEPNEGLDALRRIVVDLDVYLGRVGHVVAEYEKTGPGSWVAHDPITAYVFRMLDDARSEVSSERSRTGGIDFTPLNANRLIEDVIPVLRRIVNRRARLEAEPADREFKILADREKLSQVFAAIVAYGAGIIKKGGTITILAKMLPLKNHIGGKGGCALLSVSSEDVAAGVTPKRSDISKGSARRAFAAIRSIIGEHHGSISVVRRPGRAQFNIYLPLIREA